MADILSSLANQTAAQIDFAQRQSAKAKQIRDAAKALTLNLISQRNQLYNLFWTDAANPPQAIAAGLDATDADGTSHAGETFTLFDNDAKLVATIAAALTNAGMSVSQIGQLLPGIPSQYSVTGDPVAKTVAIAVKTSA